MGSASIYNSGGLSIFGDYWVGIKGIDFLDDTLLRLGTDGDAVMVLRSAVLNANTALANVLVGTPVARALSANSLIISNVTLSGDLAFYGNRNNNSVMFMMYDPSQNYVYFDTSRPSRRGVD